MLQELLNMSNEVLDDVNEVLETIDCFYVYRHELLASHF